MGFDIEVLEIGPAGEVDREGQPSLPRSPAFGEDEREGADPRGLSGSALRHGCAELLGSVVVEKEQELLGGGRDRLAAPEARLEKSLRLRDGGDEPGVRGGAMSPLLLGQQLLDVGRVLDPAVAIVGPPVTSDLAGAVEDAQSGFGSDQAQGPSDTAGGIE
jgi:hypothetical protein